jgi:hypothetical protein
MRGAALRCRRNRKWLTNLLELRCTAIEAGAKDPAAALSHDQDPKLPFGFAYGS